MFGKVMENADICRRVLELIVEEPIEDVEYSNVQQTIEHSKESHGIRMDAYMQSATSVYNAEMQNSRKNEVISRSRYNSALLDVNSLKSSATFNGLKKNYIIFICKFDPFDEGKCRYVFCNQEWYNKYSSVQLSVTGGENNKLLNDGTTKIFINLKGKEVNVSNELKELIDYMAGRKKGKDCKLQLIKDIDKIVTDVNKDGKWKEGCMKLELEMKMCEARGREGEQLVGIRKLVESLCKLGATMDEAIKEAAISYGHSYSAIAEICTGIKAL